jgi:hypothetical protein
MAWLKSDSFHSYRPNDPRTKHRHWNIKSEERLRTRLAEGGEDHKIRRPIMTPGFACWRETAIAIADRDGDTATVERLKEGTGGFEGMECSKGPLKLKQFSQPLTATCTVINGILTG